MLCGIIIQIPLKALSFSSPDFNPLIERHHYLSTLSRYRLETVLGSRRASLPKVIATLEATDLFS